MTSKSPLLYISRSVLAHLRETVEANEKRYSIGDFADQFSPQWALPTSLSVNAEYLGQLSPGGTPKDEIANSWLVFAALPGFSPAIATEPRIWARLAHVECLEFGRARWLASTAGQALHGLIRTHFFGESLTRYRDDHVVGRYWWNAYCATMLSHPDMSKETVLELLLERADIRSNLIERTGTMAQRALARQILHTLEKHSDLRSNESKLREFMKRINLHGSGLLFDRLPKKRVEEFVSGLV